MIFLNNITIHRSSNMAHAPILLDASLQIGSRERVGILASPGSGKSTLARVLCGIEPPFHGQVDGTCRTGWPLGYAGFLHPNLTIAENLSMVARLVGLDAYDFSARVALLSGLSAKIWHFTQDISPTERATLAYMCAMSAPAEIRVADDVLTIGNPDMRRKSTALINQHLQSGGLIYISRNPRQLHQYCTRFFALCQQKLIPCATPDIAQTLLTKERDFA